MKYFLLLVMLSLLFVAGCDDRGSENPKMYVSIPDDQLGYVYNHDNHKEMTFQIQLDGPASKLNERRVDVNITNQMGYFIGTGNTNSLITNENGYAEGRYIAGDGYGAANLEFVLETWPSEKVTKPVTVFDFPMIDSLVVGTDNLIADGTSSASLTAYVSSANIDFSDLEINVIFTAINGENGLITVPKAAVDVSGVASSNFRAPTEDAYVTIRASLELEPSINKSKSIKCQNP